jgi:PKD repeat protein
LGKSLFSISLQFEKIKHLIKMKRVVLSSLVTFMLFVTSFTWTNAQTFTTARIDVGNGCANVFNCLATSSQDTIYGFWRDGSGGSAVYKLLKWNGSAWVNVGSFNMTQVTATTPFDNGSDDVSLAIDASGNFHVAIRGIANTSCCSQERGICYAYSSNGTSWTFTNVDSYTDPSGWKNLDDPIIKIDKNGDPHIVAQFRDANSPTSFGGATGLDRVYALIHYKKTTSWSKNTIFYQSGASNEVDEFGFDLDTSGNPHVGFLRETNGTGRDGSLYYTGYNGSSWSTPTQLIAGSTGAQEGDDPTVVVNKNTNKIYITSFNYNNDIKMSTNASGSWATSNIGTAVKGSIRTAAYDQNDNGDEYLSFIDATSGNLKYAYKANGGSSWTVNTIATNNGSYYSSIVTNSGTLMTLFSHRPVGSCSSIHRELWYGTATVSTCTDATTPTISVSPSAGCSGSSRTISVTSGTLNSASSWKLYTGSCGGTLVDTTTGSTFTVSPTSTTQYWVRGSGNCTTPSACDNATATVTSPGNATFSYASRSYCKNGSNPTPTESATGTYSSTTGLSFVSTSTGQINLGASTAGTYLVTHTVNPCAATDTFQVTIVPADDPTFNYAASYCKQGSDPTPSKTSSGTFSSTTGLVFVSTSTGQLDVSASTVGTYVILFTTNGACPSTQTDTVVISDITTAFSFTPVLGCRLSDGVDFTDNTSGAVSRLWDFGDGNTSTAANPSHDYAAYGAYLVCLTTVGTYCTDSICKTVRLNAPTTATISPDVCDSYTSPSGKTWTTSGTYTDTIANSIGCDSIITVNLTVRKKTTALISPDVCDSYTSPSGKVWTTSGVRNDTIPNAANCDSVITVNLTIRVKTFATINPDVCDSYTSPSGKTWTTSGVRNDTIPNAANCDSVITVNLTIRVKTFATINPDVCDSFISPSGLTWTTTGTYMDTIPNAANCDSVITVNLTVRYASSSSFDITEYDSITLPSGRVIKISGTYMDTIPNAMLCDSVMTIQCRVINRFKTWDPVFQTLNDIITTISSVETRPVRFGSL